MRLVKKKSKNSSTTRSLRILIVFVSVVGADLLTKWLTTAIGRNADVGLIRPRVNPDFSLGVLSTDAHPAVLTALVVALTGLVTHLLLLTARQQVRLSAAPALIGGALANLIDRIATGAVHDWLYLGPVIANLADFAILWGIGVYVVTAWKLADD